MIVSGGKIIDQCWYCGKWVTLNKWCGSIHICLTDEERAAKDQQARNMRNMQQGQLGQYAGSVDLQKLLKYLKEKQSNVQTS